MATFILVHGTFAASANWPALQEGLSETAKAANDVARFEQLAWTGQNRTSARQIAAEVIFTTVKKIRANSPDEKIFIIGHSHGGSAIAYFLKAYPQEAEKLVGCAFLSTPFVAIRPRRQAMRLIFTVGFLLITAILAWWMVRFQPATPKIEILDSLKSRGPVYWLGFGFAAAIGAVGLLIAKRIRDKGSIEKTIDETIGQQTADIPVGNYLFLRCSGDEAAAALSAAQFIAWSGMKVSTQMERLLGPLFSRRRIVRFAFVNLFFIMVGNDIVLSIQFLPDLGGMIEMFPTPFTDYSAKGLLLLALLLLIFAVPIVFVICFVIGFVVFATQALTSWVFGWTRLAAGFLVELAIEPLPFGMHSLIHIDWNTSSTGLDGIVHSWTYAHPVAISHLQDWVRSGLQ
jgi:pimeloyl-ACP methyl ester carboxylesterase